MSIPHTHHHPPRGSDTPRRSFDPATAIVMGAGQRLLVAVAASGLLWLTVRWALS